MYLLGLTVAFYLSSAYFAAAWSVNKADVLVAIAGLQTKYPQYGPKPVVNNRVWRVLEQRAHRLSRNERLVVTNLVTKYGAMNGHDPYLLLAMIEVESGFRGDAVSHKGARGLMQIRPFVARAMAAELKLNPDEAVKRLKELRVNVRLGAYYLAKMRKRYGDLTLALEAYNRGPTRLDSFIRSGAALKKRYSRRVLESRNRILSIAGNEV